jgi:membrane protein required for colicin V production
LENWPITAGDVLVILVLLLSGALAFARGFVREALSVAAWVGAALVTVFALPHASPLVRDLIDNELVADFIAGVLIFIAALVGLSVGGHFATKAIRDSALNMLDRSLGLVFGLVRGVLLLSLGYMLFVWLVPDDDDHPDWFSEARTLPLVEEAADILRIVVPTDVIGEGLDAAEDTLDQLGRLGPVLIEGRSISAATQAAAPTVVPAAKPDAPEDEDGYNRRAREEMDRLLATSR